MKPRISSSGARWKVAVAVCGLAMLAAGCGSSGGTPSASTPASATTPATTAPASAPSSDSVLCADAAALRSSLGNLGDVKVRAGAASEITANLNRVKTNLTAFVGHAHDQWKAQTSALSSALSTLNAAVSDLAAHPSSSTVSGVVTALKKVNTAGRNLLDAVSPTCPSASPSASPSSS